MVCATPRCPTSSQSMYQKALVLHVIALVLVISLGAIFVVFVLRPAHARVVAESRRVAQLLSALPPEYDIEGMLGSTLLVRSSGGDPQSQLEAAARAREAARAATATSMRKARSG